MPLFLPLFSTLSSHFSKLCDSIRIDLIPVKLIINCFLFLGQAYFCCITATFEFVTFSTYFPFCSSLSSLAMDFGSSNHVREPKSLHLIVTNTSGISSNLSLSVRHYPSPQTGREGGAVATDRKQK